MAKVSTSVSLDAEVREKALPILSELGLDLSTAIGIFLRQTIREQRIPFEVSLQTPNGTTRAAIHNSMNNEDVFGPYDSVSSLMEALNA